MQCPHCFREVNTVGACPYCGFDPTPLQGKYPLALKPGSILNGRYILGHVLGQGGFGITYIALDYQTKERAAIKEYFPAEFAGRSGVSVQVHSRDHAENFSFGKAQFLEEAKTLAAFIGNAGIVRIYSYFEENGTAYLSMEYVDGLPLNKYMAAQGGRLTTAEADRLLLPLMESLEAVHAKGIVHRDIAPDNILVTPQGAAKLIDFGAARYSTGEKSRSLDVILKHGFAPYEQYMRRGRQGPWTDVYALAATYYYAITGKVPPEAVERKEEDTLVPPSTLGVKISHEQEDVLLRALEVSVSERFQSMDAFRRAMLEASGVDEESRREQELRAELERIERNRRERQAKEERVRLEREQAAREAREKAAREERERAEQQARAEAERRRREEEARKAREKAEREERERKKREERAEAERKRREEKAEAERLRREEKERRAREKAARIERDKAEKAARKEAKEQAGADGGEKPRKSKLPLILGAAALLAAVLFFAFGSKGKPEAPVVSGEPEMQTPAPTPEPTPDTRGARYEEAEKLLADGKAQKAWTAFRALGDFRDAQERADRIAEDMRHANSTPIAVGSNHMAGLKKDGTAVAKMFSTGGISTGGIFSYSCDVSDWIDIVSVAAGASHTVGLKADGTVNTVGSNKSGQCGVSDWTDIVSVAAGSFHTVGLCADGTVVAVGDNSDGQCNVAGWTDIVSVAAGADHTLGLKANGTVVAVGENTYGQCEVTDWKDIVAVAAGERHTVGVKADGTVIAVGDNQNGQCEISAWKDIVSVAAGTYHTMGLKADGTAVAVGKNSYGQCKVTGWRNLVAVAAGGDYTAGLKADGTVAAVGAMSGYIYSRLDVSDWTNIGVPK